MPVENETLNLEVVADAQSALGDASASAVDTDLSEQPDDDAQVGSENDGAVADVTLEEDPAAGLEGSPKAQERIRELVSKLKEAEAERDAARAAAVAEREALQAERAREKAEHEQLLAQWNFEAQRQEWIAQDQRVLEDLNSKLARGDVDEALAQTQWELYQARRASEFREMQVSAQSQQLSQSQKELREARIERELATLTRKFDALDDDDIEEIKGLHLAGKGELAALAQKRHDKNVAIEMRVKAAEAAKRTLPPPRATPQSGEGGGIASGRKDAMPDPDKDPVKWQAWFDRKKMEGHRLKETVGEFS